MWALVGLKETEAENIEEMLGVGGLWSILLFREADTLVAEALAQNWSFFNQSLGRNAHIITLLNVSHDPGGRTRIQFPSNYEAEVGKFCNILNVPGHELPALVLLNAPVDEEGRKPYWSLKRATKRQGSEALIELVGEIQKATSSFPPSVEPHRTDWLRKATHAVLNTVSGRESVHYITEKSPIFMDALKILIRFLKLK